MVPERSTSSMQESSERVSNPRPKSMFARPIAQSSKVKESPHIPNKSPRRLKRLSMLLKPPFEVENEPKGGRAVSQPLPHNTSVPASTAPKLTLAPPVSPLKTPSRSPSLQRQGSLQRRLYNYEDEDEWPSPRRSLCSVSSPVQSPQRRPLFADRSESYLSSPKPSPSLPQSPGFETQNSVWIAEDRPQPRPSLDKRTSLLGRTLSVRDSKKRLSGLSCLDSPVISSPQFLESSNPLTNAVSVAKANPKPSPSPSQLQPRPQPQPQKSPRISQIIRRIWGSSPKPDAKAAKPAAPTKTHSPAHTPIPRTSLERRPAEEKRRKYQSAGAAPTRPSRAGTGLGLLRAASQLSLQSSNDSQTGSQSIVTPTNHAASPRVHIEEWEYPSLNQKQWEQNFHKKNTAWI